jgi:hypothetical protein
MKHFAGIAKMRMREAAQAGRYIYKEAELK